VSFSKSPFFYVVISLGAWKLDCKGLGIVDLLYVSLELNEIWTVSVPVKF